MLIRSSPYVHRSRIGPLSHEFHPWSRPILWKEVSTWECGCEWIWPWYSCTGKWITRVETPRPPLVSWTSFGRLDPSYTFVVYLLPGPTLKKKRVVGTLFFYNKVQDDMCIIYPFLQVQTVVGGNRPDSSLWQCITTPSCYNILGSQVLYSYNCFWYP